MGRPRKGYRVATMSKPEPKPRLVRQPKPGLIPDYTLYRLYDAHDRLLYVGVTRDLTERLRTHRERKQWWREVTSVSTVLFETWREVEDAEQVAIRTENPVHNIAGREGSGYAITLAENQEPAVPSPRSAPDAPIEQIDPDEPVASFVAIYPNALVIDGTKLTDITVTDTLLAGQGLMSGDVVVDLRIRVRAKRIELNGEREGPAPVDF